MFYGLCTEFLQEKNKKYKFHRTSPWEKLQAPPMFTEEECLRRLRCSCYRIRSQAMGTVFELKTVRGECYCTVLGLVHHLAWQLHEISRNQQVLSGMK